MLHPCAESEAFSIWKKYLFDALSSSKVIRILSTFVTMFGIISVANYVVIFLGFIDIFLKVLWMWMKLRNELTFHKIRQVLDLFKVYFLFHYFKKILL